MILTGNLHLLIERHMALEKVRICEKDTRGEGFHTRNASPIPLDVYQGEWLLYAYDLRHIHNSCSLTSFSSSTADVLRSKNDSSATFS